MAKVKSSGLRNYIGRLGGSVYYMLNGQNIARELASQVSNPRTTSQMRQRMQWANLVNTYKANKGWMGKLSFENKPRTQSDYNAFMAANLGVDPVYINKQMADNDHAILAPYTMTRGSLPAIKLEWSDGDSKFMSDIKLDSEFAPTNATVADLSEQIVRNNPGWEYGDQLSIIEVVNANYTPRVYPLEIILSASDDRNLDDLTNGIAYGDTLFLKNPYDVLCSSGTDGHTSDYYAMIYVHSRTTGSKTSVSTQQYVLSPAAVTLYNQATSESAFEEAAASYGVTDQPFLATEEAASGTAAELALKTLEASASVDGDIVIKTMTNGGANQFGSSFTGDVVGGEELIFRFNRYHGFAEDAAVTLSYVKNGGSSTSVTISGTPSIAANYVIIKPSGLQFNTLTGAVTFTLTVGGDVYTFSVGA